MRGSLKKLDSKIGPVRESQLPSRMSDSRPVGTLHWQVYICNPSLHVPPFRQGEDWHSSVTT